MTILMLNTPLQLSSTGLKHYHLLLNAVMQIYDNQTCAFYRNNLKQVESYKI